MGDLPLGVDVLAGSHGEGRTSAARAHQWLSMQAQGSIGRQGETSGAGDGAMPWPWSTRRVLGLTKGAMKFHGTLVPSRRVRMEAPKI